MSYRIPVNSPDLHAGGGGPIANFDLAFGVEYDGASGAIAAKEGTVFLTKAGVAAMTLAAPVAGLPSVGGDDGRELTIMDVTGNAHTVTTPAGGINGNKHIATFGAVVGQFGTFVAYNGAWYLAASSGVTLT